MSIWLWADGNSFQRRPICVLVFREVSCADLKGWLSHTGFLLVPAAVASIFSPLLDNIQSLRRVPWFHPSMNAFPQSASAHGFSQWCSITCWHYGGSSLGRSLLEAPQTLCHDGGGTSYWMLASITFQMSVSQLKSQEWSCLLGMFSFPFLISLEFEWSKTYSLLEASWHLQVVIKCLLILFSTVLFKLLMDYPVMT